MKRVQQRRGVKLPPNTKSVARPSRWGNPYKVGTSIRGARPLERSEAVALYRGWASGRVYRDPDWLEPLRGHDLACYCPLDQPCHAAVLLELLADG